MLVNDPSVELNLMNDGDRFVANLLQTNTRDALIRAEFGSRTPYPLDGLCFTFTIDEATDNA